MQQYLESSFGELQLRKDLMEKDSEFYIIRQDDAAAGYMKINFGNAQTDIRDKNGMEIERIYALKEYHGKGIGHIMYNTALKRATESGADYIWLGVWEKNLRAINFYEKIGFKKVGEHVFKLGKDVQTDYIMKIQIKGKPET